VTLFFECIAFPASLFTRFDSFAIKIRSFPHPSFCDGDIRHASESTGLVDSVACEILGMAGAAPEEVTEDAVLRWQEVGARDFPPKLD
jgi:hypothetical protein